MSLKIAAAALAALTVTAAGAACAEDFVTIPLETTINAPADKAWPKISGYCLIGAWFKTTCTVAGADGQVGSVRTIAGRVKELLVAKTAWSYTYSQPKSPIDYHGTVEIQPIDKKTSKLLYTLVYDADALPKHEPEDKAKDRDNRTKQFTVLINAMKAAAEAK
jgi:hypothetical protein